MKYLTFIIYIISTLFTFGQNRVTSTASVTLLTPMTISNESSLEFGAVTNNGGGSVTLSHTRTSSGGVTLSNQGLTPSRAVCSVTGTSNTSYLVNIPDNIVIYNGESSMVITQLTVSFENDNSTPLIGKLDSIGKDKFRIGGTLNIGSNQVVGTYSGTFDINVNYN